MSTKLRIGLWGCGNMGRSLAEALTATDEAELAAVYDLLPDACAQVADAYETTGVDSTEALVDGQELDGVIIALPTHQHAPATIQAAQAGLHVFVEKPMALTVADCQLMIDAAEANDIQLMVGHVVRYYEPYRTIKRLQTEGRLGQLFAASIWRLGSADKRYAPGNWRNFIDQSGGFLLEVGAHELDMLRYLMGTPQTVSALHQRVLERPDEWEDYVSVQIRFPHGAGLYETGKGSYRNTYGFRIMFEEATLFSDAAFNPSALQVYRTGGEIESWEDEFGDEDPRQAELKDWLAACRGEKPVAIPGQEGLATIALAEAARRSVKSKQAVPYQL